MRNVLGIHLFSGLMVFAFGFLPLVSSAHASGPGFNDTTNKPASSASPSFSGTVALPSGVWGTDGNVGIGTTAPGQKLEVIGNAKVSGTVFGNAFNDSLAGSNALSFATANNPVLYGYTSTNLDTVLGSGYLAFKIANAEKVRIDNNGNVGIGTASPASKVQIAADYSSNGTDDLGQLLVSGSTDSAKRLQLAYNTSGNYGIIRAVDAGVAERNLIFNPGGGGNVGIRTTAPAALLQIGSGTQSLSANLSANSALIIGNLEVDGKIYGDGSSLTGVPTVSAMSAGYIPRASSNTALTNSVVYDNGANIGIGTASPAAKLDLVGTGTTSATSALVIRDSVNVVKVTVLDNGNVGIGTSAPSAKVTINGTEDVVQLKVYGNSSQTNDIAAMYTSAGSNILRIDGNGNFGFGVTPSTSYKYYLYSSTTDGTASHYTQRNMLSASPSANSSAFFIGAENVATKQGAADLTGGYGSGGLVGLMNLAVNNGSGTVANAYGSIQTVQTTQGGNITNAYSLFVPNAYVINGGVVSNNYGVYIENQTAGGSLNYALYSKGGSNYFGGNVGIGTTISSAKLQVGTGSQALAADLSANSALIIGNLEVDGKIYGDGSSLTGVPTVSAMSAGYIPRASSATALTNSVMYDNGANIGIGTASPGTRLEIYNDNNYSPAMKITSTRAGSGGGAVLQVIGGSQVYETVASFSHTDAGVLRNSSIYGLDLSYTTAALGGIGAYDYEYAGGRFVITHNGAPTSAKKVYGVISSATANAANFEVYAGYFMGASTNGTAYGVYSAAGKNYFNNNVGIGTISPAAKLDLVGTGTTSATSALVIRDSTNTAKVTVLDNGNIGIGTTVPGEKLVIAGVAGTTNLKIDVGAGGNVVIEGGGGIANIKASQQLGFGSGGWERIRLDNSGYVGIGTTAPVAKVDVGGGTLTNIDGVNDLLVKGDIEADGNVYGTAATFTGSVTADSFSGSGVISGLSSGYVPRASSGTALTDSLIYDNGVNIGIGTASPAAKLDLVGTGTTSATSALIIRDSAKAAKVTVLDNGNIGIGTTAPGARLVIGGGHVHASGATPTLSSCGTGSPSIVGNDIAGTITPGSATSTCTMNFANAWTNVPHCVITGSSTASVKAITSASTSAIVIESSASDMNSEVLYYICIGRE